MTKIPLSIKSDLNDDIFEYLTESEADGIISIKWDLHDVEISYDIPKISRYWPKFSEIKKHTPEFEFYEYFGYTINNFREFLIIAEDWDYAPNITVQTDDKIEISIGELTPRWREALSRAKKTKPLNHEHRKQNNTIKKISILMIIGTAIISCTNDDEKGISNHCDFKAIVSTNQYKNASSELLIVSSLEISSNCLKINISASGCDGNSWEVKLIDSEQIMESYPAQRNLRITLKNDEVCTAYVGKTFTFDISELQIQDNDRVYLNIINSDDQILYEY